MASYVIKAHASFCGFTGYNKHCQDFFGALNNYIPVRIRNFSYDKRFIPTKEQKLMLIKQTLNDKNGNMKTYPYYSSYNDSDKIPINIILNESNHHYFYDKYSSPKIAYNVWETTRQLDYFFEKLLEYDQLWVPSEWQKKCSIEQGYPASKIKVVPEAVDGNIFKPFEKPYNYWEHPLKEYKDGRFKFLLFGRWDYRKSTKNIIETFLKTFDKNEEVDLIALVDNPYSIDGMNSTEERLKYHGLNDKRIKVKHFLSDEDYLIYLKSGHVFVSCSRGEGWNRPLAEAMACGIPTISSNYGAQLEFTTEEGPTFKNLSHLVNIIDERQAKEGNDESFCKDWVGNFCEPDFDHLGKVFRDVYENYEEYQKDAIINSVRMRKKYSLDNAARVAYFYLKELTQNKEEGTVSDEIEIKNNEVIIVNSYTDTKEKQDILKNCLRQLNKTNKEIILSTHYPVDIETQNLVNYYIYDFRNPLLKSRGTFYWYESDDIYFESTKFDIGKKCFANMLGMQNGIEIAKKLNKDFFYYIEYDCIIDNTELQKFDELKNNIDLNNKKGYVQFINTKRNKSLSTMFFAFYTDFFIEHYKFAKSIEEYESRFENNIGLGLEWYSYYNIKSKFDDLIVKEAKSSFPLYFERSNLGKCIGSTHKLHYIDIVPKEETKEPVLFIYAQDIDNGKYEIDLLDKYENLKEKIIFEVKKRGDIYNKTLSREIEYVIVYYEDEEVCRTKVKEKIKNPHGFFREKKKINKFFVNFIDGAFLDIKGNRNEKYEVEFLDKDTNSIIHKTTQKTNMWTRTTRQYFTNWNINCKLNGKKVYEHNFDCKNKRVFIVFESKSLGDTISWIPYVDIFRKKHKCNVICSTFWNNLYEKEYPEIEFIKPGTIVHNLYALYRVGWWDKKEEFKKRNPVDARTIPLQKTITDILGLDFKEVIPKITIPNKKRNIKEKYICISINSTCQAKYWNYPNGWKEVISHLINKGYKIVNISKEKNYMGNKEPERVIDKTGNKPIEDRIIDLKYADFFIGLGSGLSWLSWAIGTPVVMICGHAKRFQHFQSNMVHIQNENVCIGCFTDTHFNFDRGEWNWCPLHKGTKRQFECTKSITPKMVIDGIKFIQENYL